MTRNSMLLDDLEVEIAPFASSDTVAGPQCVVIIAMIMVFVYQQTEPI